MQRILVKTTKFIVTGAVVLLTLYIISFMSVALFQRHYNMETPQSHDINDEQQSNKDTDVSGNKLLFKKEPAQKLDLIEVDGNEHYKSRINAKRKTISVIAKARDASITSVLSPDSSEGLQSSSRSSSETRLVSSSQSRSKPSSQGNTSTTSSYGSSMRSTTSITSDSKFEYHGHDLLKDQPFSFNKQFKNPCWYEGDQLRCLPYYYVIGVKKCGTSDVFKKIYRHPHVINPGFKEAQFFARRRFRYGEDDINIYVDKFAKAAAHIQSAEKQYHFNPFITGEGSPSNLHLNNHWMYLPGNEHLSEPRVVILDYIKHFVPDAKIIVVFRDPVERLYSDYYHEYGTLVPSNHPNPGQFHEVVSKGIQLYKECFVHHSVRSCVYNPELYKQTKIQMQLGIYCVFWEELLRVFRRDQILVLQNRNLSSEETVSRLFGFLGLEPMTESQLKATEKATPTYARRPQYKKEGPMLNTTFNMLYEFYKPFNEKMAKLTNDPTFLYSHDYM